jgi:hypothetical protein
LCVCVCVCCRARPDNPSRRRHFLPPRPTVTPWSVCARTTAIYKKVTWALTRKTLSSSGSMDEFPVEPEKNSFLARQHIYTSEHV